MRYSWYRNVTPDALWFGYKPGDTVEFAYAGDSVLDEIEGARRELFEVFNVAPPSDYRGRSMSVGDVVMFGDEIMFACASVGWHDGTPEMARSVLAAEKVRLLDAAVLAARVDPENEELKAKVRDAMDAYFEAALARQGDEYIARTK